MRARANDYTLQENVALSVGAAENQGNDYHFFAITPSQDGYIEISLSTIGTDTVEMDICNGNKVVVASDLQLSKNQTILHRVEKNKVCYLRIPQKENLSYSIGYRMRDLSFLDYGAESSFTITNASFPNEANAITMKLKATKSGILMLSGTLENKCAVKFYDKKMKSISDATVLVEEGLTGIGVKEKGTYLVKLWNMGSQTAGTTTISNLKYQIKELGIAKNKTKGKSILLNSKRTEKKEALVLAGKNTTYWYKVSLKKKKKLTITVESRLLQCSGSGLIITMYDKKGKKLTNASILMDEKLNVSYKDGNYVLFYPKKEIVTKKLKKGTYYIKIESKSKKTSGSFSIGLN
jgi:hypothetical protein